MILLGITLITNILARLLIARMGSQRRYKGPSDGIDLAAWLISLVVPKVALEGQSMSIPVSKQSLTLHA